MGKIVNNEYELLKQLGQGGMGVVYKARHIHFDETVAIKRLWEQFSNDPTVLELFRNEGKILRGLHHKNIVQVSGLFAFEGSHYIVMEYIEGRTLSDIIKREVGPIKRDRAINLFKQMLEGVAYIHNQPKTIIHRDLKPLNILVTADDAVKITDFGIAKALDAGGQASTVVKGTPVYMSPEQIINPKSVDIRTDVYALGMTFYEMLCAKTPFQGDTATTPTAVYAAIMNGEVPPPTEFYPAISDELSAFVMKAIHKDRNQRFANASEMHHELERLELSGATTVQGPIKTAPPVEKKPVPEKTTDTKEQETVIDGNTNTTQEDNELKKVSKYLIGGFVVLVLGLLLTYGLTGRKKADESMLIDSVKVEVSPSVEYKTPEMIVVEGGTFEMGSTNGESDEKPVHQVTVSSFLIGKYEVTQALWESIMGSNPSSYKGNVRPVESVSWYDVVEFCNKLSEKEGLQKAYSGSGENIKCDFTSNGYRLPTEAEWEYAARGGNKSRGYKYSGSNDLDQVGWYTSNSGSETKEVGKKQPNELGLYDMSGNVWEWCWDWKGEYSSSSQTDPRGPNSGSVRVNRGGGWHYSAEYCRVAVRIIYFCYPVVRSHNLGFRLVRTKN